MPNDANKNTEIKKLKKIADYLQNKEEMVEIELYTNERYEVEEYYVVTIGENYVGINESIQENITETLSHYKSSGIVLAQDNAQLNSISSQFKTLEDMIRSANILLKFGVKNILIKGGHRNTKIMQDLFINKKEMKIFRNKKINTKNTHGTGCTLSSAIATFFACGKSINKSCELGIKYVNQSIRSNLNYGKGHGPINHLSSINIDSKFK